MNAGSSRHPERRVLCVGDAFGRYVVESLLGHGGMGSVYRALDTKLERRVALKVLGAAGDQAVTSALREARAAAAIQHPCVAQVYDAGEVEGAGYIVMELVAGASLRAFVGDASVDVSTRVRWLSDVALALAASHARGIIHRDVKPENVIIRDDGAVKVLDFGVARPHVDPGDASYVTLRASGVLLGTPAYMAPEHARAQDVDARADQFSWGVVAYELLRGASPWPRARGAMAMLAAIITEEPEPLPTTTGIPAPVADAVMRALSRSRDDRFASMEDLLTVLAPHAAPPPRERLLSSPDLGPRRLPSTRPSAAPLARSSSPRPPPPSRPPSAPPASSLRPRAQRFGRGFRDPDFAAPVDLAEHLAAIPAGATCKGMIPHGLVAEGARAGSAGALFQAAGIAERRYFPFSDYPVADAARLLHACAPLVHPGVPRGEGLRRLGRSVFDVVADSRVGKVVFGVFDFDVEQLLLRGARIYGIVHNHGAFAAEKAGPDRYLLHVRDFPSFLETAQVGVLEGVLRLTRRRGRIRFQLDAIDRGTFEIVLL